MTVSIIQGDCREVLPTLEAGSFHAAVTDPPYMLNFMSKPWDRARAPEIDADFANWLAGFIDGEGLAVKRYGSTFSVEQLWHYRWAREVYRVLKPGGFLLAFGGTRTFHRLACAIEDAGFEIRDTIMWIYGSGFPKSLDVSRAIDRAAGAEREVVGNTAEFSGRTIGEGTSNGFHGNIISGHCREITAPATAAAREWQGWGTSLKPACEMVCVARKPSVAVSSAEVHGLTGWDHWCSSKSDGEDEVRTGRALHPGARSFRVRIDKHGREVSREDLGAYEPFAVDAVAANVLRHGTGALNIDACRIPAGDKAAFPAGIISQTEAVYGGGNGRYADRARTADSVPTARWPANVCHDGSPEVMDAFAKFGERPVAPHGPNPGMSKTGMFARNGEAQSAGCYEDSGTAARFYFCAKADASERVGNHPTVKPVALMEWLVRLVTPPGGRVLDPFCGTGSTLVACDRLGFDAVGIEQDAQTVADAHEKLRRMRARRMIGDVQRAPAAPGQLQLL